MPESRRNSRSGVRAGIYGAKNGRNKGSPASGRRTFRTAPEKDAIVAHAITDAPKEAAAIAEKFDLRQAVIYSEILKPRFDEE